MNLFFSWDVTLYCSIISLNLVFKWRLKRTEWIWNTYFHSDVWKKCLKHSWLCTLSWFAVSRIYPSPLSWTGCNTRSLIPFRFDFRYIILKYLKTQTRCQPCNENFLVVKPKLFNHLVFFFWSAIVTTFQSVGKSR